MATLVVSELDRSPIGVNRHHVIMRSQSTRPKSRRWVGVCGSPKLVHVLDKAVLIDILSFPSTVNDFQFESTPPSFTLGLLCLDATRCVWRCRLMKRAKSHKHPYLSRPCVPPPSAVPMDVENMARTADSKESVATPLRAVVNVKVVADGGGDGRWQIDCLGQVNSNGQLRMLQSIDHKAVVVDVGPPLRPERVVTPDPAYNSLTAQCLWDAHSRAAVSTADTEVTCSTILGIVQAPPAGDQRRCLGPTLALSVLQGDQSSACSLVLLGGQVAVWGDNTGCVRWKAINTASVAKKITAPHVMGSDRGHGQEPPQQGLVLQGESAVVAVLHLRSDDMDDTQRPVTTETKDPAVPWEALIIVTRAKVYAVASPKSQPVGTDTPSVVCKEWTPTSRPNAVTHAQDYRGGLLLLCSDGLSYCPVFNHTGVVEHLHVWRCPLLGPFRGIMAWPSAWYDSQGNTDQPQPSFFLARSGVTVHNIDVSVCSTSEENPPTSHSDIKDQLEEIARIAKEHSEVEARMSRCNEALRAINTVLLMKHLAGTAVQRVPLQPRCGLEVRVRPMLQRLSSISTSPPVASLQIHLVVQLINHTEHPLVLPADHVNLLVVLRLGRQQYNPEEPSRPFHRVWAHRSKLPACTLPSNSAAECDRSVTFEMSCPVVDPLESCEGDVQLLFHDPDTATRAAPSVTAKFTPADAKEEAAVVSLRTFRVDMWSYISASPSLALPGVAHNSSATVAGLGSTPHAAYVLEALSQSQLAAGSQVNGDEKAPNHSQVRNAVLTKVPDTVQVDVSVSRGMLQAYATPQQARLALFEYLCPDGTQFVESDPGQSVLNLAGSDGHRLQVTATILPISAVWADQTPKQPAVSPDIAVLRVVLKMRCPADARLAYASDLRHRMHAFCALFSEQSTQSPLYPSDEASEAYLEYFTQALSPLYETTQQLLQEHRDLTAAHSARSTAASPADTEDSDPADKLRALMELYIRWRAVKLLH